MEGFEARSEPLGKYQCYYFFLFFFRQLVLLLLKTAIIMPNRRNHSQFLDCLKLEFFGSLSKTSDLFRT
ncbi:unnamed protein product [Coffea canephora]|uniref:Uncharacterized protein n=1 Tax=Coffea canephora TaxID=49390 RepID=A0A068URK4_COFCA|nr:unnamed protein product [Coffea canephora]